MSDAFEFGADRSAEENIELFLRYQESRDAQLGQILRGAVESLLPLPDPGAARNTKREAANAKVIEGLESKKSEES
jgi:hypothetical protein